MSKIAYIEKRFSQKSQIIIQTANDIIEEYSAQGFDLTLRQLYYQFVARDIIHNKQSEYKRLGSIISDARLAGEVDWEAITDRTRQLRSNPHWKTTAEVIRSASYWFALDKRGDQDIYIEVWIEKDALVGVISEVCDKHDVPYFSCRGYVSQSEMWEAGKRMNNAFAKGKKVILFHLGDHDPSGIDMTRDIQERLNLFTYDQGVQVKRIALNMKQVEKYGPPPNPAKITDSRFDSYVAEYGEESWELDALEPSALVKLIDGNVSKCTDILKWDKKVEKEEGHKEELLEMSIEKENENE